MTLKIGINGFGRIGRLAYRYASQFNDVEVVAINDLVPAEQLAYLLGHDTVHGLFPMRGQGSVTATGNKLQVLDAAGQAQTSSEVTAHRDPAEIPWTDFGVDVVFECTGLFLTQEAGAKHFSGPKNSGVERVILSAPAKDAEIRTVVFKVNDDTITADDRVMSNSSCTTNCLAPIVSVMREAFGVDNVSSVYFNTIHAYTNDQNTVDGPHKDPRRARAAAANIIPTSTGAAKAISKIFPELAGNIKGVATRVPVPDGSATDIVFSLKVDTDEETVIKALTAAAAGRLKGVLEASNDHLVSSDIVGNPHSSIADLQQTVVLAGKTVRVLSWYDNEMGYSCRMVDLARSLFL